MFGKKKTGSQYNAGNYKDHSYVARNTEVIGDIRFKGGLHIEGKVVGNIESAEGSLHIHGEVRGEIRVPHVVIDGVVEGEVYVAEHVELAAHAVVRGNIHYKSIEMQLGAQINGGLFQQDSAPPRIEYKPEAAPVTDAVKG